MGRDVVTAARRLLGGVAVVAAALLVLGPATPAVAAPGPADTPEWWFDSWNVSALWREGADGRGITIAEIDSGVNASLPQLATNVLPGTDLGSLGGDGRTDRDIDTFGHGTAMASIMVAQRGPFGIEGLAPAAKVLPVAIPLQGTTDAADDDHLPAAIIYAADHGAKIINMSLGGQRDPSEDSEPCPDDEQEAITYAVSKGAILVAAAGNSGQSGSPVEEPGVCLGVVTVGAVDSTDTIADFSSRHPYVTVSAPGVRIPSLGRIPGQAFSGDGTSQATAITSAALALIWSKFPSLTNDQIVARLLSTLDRRTATADPGYGYGVIDPARAIATAVPADAPDPVFAAVAPYLAIEQAQLAASPVPPTAPVTTGSAPPGRFVVGSAPGRVTAPVIYGGAVALAGLLALVVLVVVGLLRRRRLRVVVGVGGAAGVGFAAGGGGVGPSPGWAGVGWGSDPPLDPTIPWHEVVPPPPTWSAPLTPPDWSGTQPAPSLPDPPGPPIPLGPADQPDQLDS